MLGPFATASRLMPPVLHCHSPGVATVARRLRIDVHNNINDNNDNAWQSGPLWPHRMGPMIYHPDCDGRPHVFPFLNRNWKRTCFVTLEAQNAEHSDSFLFRALHRYSVCRPMSRRICCFIYVMSRKNRQDNRKTEKRLFAKKHANNFPSANNTNNNLIKKYVMKIYKRKTNQFSRN